MGLLTWLIVGLIAGAVARLIVPGRDPMGWLGTIVLGLVGSLIGGFLFSVLLGGDGDFQPASIIGSIVGAIVALLIYRNVGSRSHTGTPVGTRRL